MPRPPPRRPRTRPLARRARAPQDGSYKHLFSHPEMVEGLLCDFVHEDWLTLIDFSTLEKQGGSYVTDDLREREDDIIWRVRVAGEWLYVYPQHRYHLIDEGRIGEDTLEQASSVAAELVRLETLASDGPAALRPILRRLGARLQGPRYASLRRALTVWFARVLLRRLLPGEQELLPQLSPGEKAQLLQWVARDLGGTTPGIDKTPGICGGGPSHAYPHPRLDPGAGATAWGIRGGIVGKLSDAPR